MSAAIIVPTYNSAATLPETLASIQHQLQPNRISNVILADDASSDETCAVAEKCWTGDVPLRVLRAEHNRGERDNVNTAVEALSKEVDWFFVLHSDDVAKPHWLEIMFAQIYTCSDRVATICSSWDDWMPDGTIVPGEENPQRTLELIEGTAKAVHDTLWRGCWWHLSGCAIRLAAFHDVGPFNPSMPQLGDLDWLLRVLHAGWAVEYIPRTLILYRQHAASVSSGSFRNDRDIREGLQIFARYRDALTRGQILRWHERRLRFCARRFARSLVQRDLQRMRTVLQTAGLVIRSAMTGPRKIGSAEIECSQS